MQLHIQLLRTLSMASGHIICLKAYSNENICIAESPGQSPSVDLANILICCAFICCIMQFDADSRMPVPTVFCFEHSNHNLDSKSYSYLHPVSIKTKRLPKYCKAMLCSKQNNSNLRKPRSGFLSFPLRTPM